MIDWTAIRTAYKVATLGTVSAAAEELGIHRASVVRHIDVAEEQLGQKIFIRNQRGYQPTEIGLDLIKMAGVAESQLNLLASKAQNHAGKLSGELVISSEEFHPSLILPSIERFQDLYPDVHLRLLSGEHAGQLEYGESHIVLQPVRMMNHPDYVVQELDAGEMRLYASKKYVQKYGTPKTEDDFKHHRFFKPAHPTAEVDFSVWLEETVPLENFYFCSNSFELSRHAIIAGITIGFIPSLLVSPGDELIQILPDKPAWKFPFWVVTHRDVHRSLKVQAFLNVLKESLQ